MVCAYCGKPIGLVRRIKDPNFCCHEHRRKLVSRSARALREAEDLYGSESACPTTWKQVETKTKENRPGPATTVFAMLAIVFLILAVSEIPVTTSSYISPLPDTGKPAAGGRFGGVIAGLIRSGGPSTIQDDFRSGIANWDGARGEAADWSFEGASVRPGRLRIWNKSTPLSNYEFEFMSKIERKSLGWAFRASDSRNYYATKLSITRPGPAPNAGLVRFVVIDGRERERMELPLPLTLERNTDYRVRLSVRGNSFLTSVNGELVSSWTDSRLARGGVGFFAENGESALVKWASLSERDSFLGRIVSHFSLIASPAFRE